MCVLWLQRVATSVPLFKVISGVSFIADWTTHWGWVIGQYKIAIMIMPPQCSFIIIIFKNLLFFYNPNQPVFYLLLYLYNNVCHIQLTSNFPNFKNLNIVLHMYPA